MRNIEEETKSRTITNEAIKRAITRSGYLIEQRVAEKLVMMGYYVDLNPTFFDKVTSKTREVDISADSTYRSPQSSEGFITGAHWKIVCECENNSQPIVFFPYEVDNPSERYLLIKYFGVPIKAWKEEQDVDILTFLGLRQFHHYCEGEIATQYCSFAKGKQGIDWIATHAEEQHETFDKLVAAIHYELEEFCKDWDLPEHDNEEPMYLEFKYPLIVLGGNLIAARLGKRGIKLKKARHIRYWKTAYINGEEENYIIDVITEDYLGEYVSIIDKEMKKVRRLLISRKKIVKDSIIRILKEARASESPTETYRQLICPPAVRR